MATRPGRLIDKTFTSFTEASGRLEDTIGWVVTAAEAFAHEFEPGCKAEVTLHLLGKRSYEKALTELDTASARVGNRRVRRTKT